MARRRDIDRLAELEELFADLWQVPRFAAGMRLTHRPQIDVFRTEDPPELTLVVELPGANPDALRIVLDGRRAARSPVTASGRAPTGRSGTAARSSTARSSGEVSLAFDVDVDEAKASYERGLLASCLPLTERAPAPMRVSIEVLRVAVSELEIETPLARAERRADPAGPADPAAAARRSSSPSR